MWDILKFQTYNIPLLNDSYNYHQEEKKLPGGTPALFITIKTISGYTQNMISTLQSAEIELSHQQQKGAIYCFVLHLLLIILMISIFKTIFTHAGLVSKVISLKISNIQQEINLKTEEKATRALEIEKRVLRNRWKKRKELNSKATESQKEEESVIILNKEGNITVENQPLISDKNSDSNHIRTILQKVQENFIMKKNHKNKVIKVKMVLLESLLKIHNSWNNLIRLLSIML